MKAFHRKRLRERLQCFAGAVANVCGNGCNALRLRRQNCTEIVCPILDKRKGRRDTPHMGHSSPPDLSGEPVLAGKVANISVEDAVHCKGGCSALRLKWV